MDTNKSLGNSFESKFCDLLFQKGFWVHNLAPNQSGQPADIIAVRNGVAFLIDCKVCSGKVFSLSRVEDNQRMAMKLWDDCGNGAGWFAVKFGENIYMAAIWQFDLADKVRLSEAWFIDYAEPLEEWLGRGVAT